jgi:putative glycerol-1-phosphate prenyltransferase
MLYNQILAKLNREKIIAILIDPDKSDEISVVSTIEKAEKAGIDFFLIGGSLISKTINDKITLIKRISRKPVFLLPGNILQLCDKADGIFLLSLISGRNPDFLIGSHVNAAPFLKSSSLEIIPTGYILIDTGKPTSVEYISNTRPIPGDKPDIAVATAIAGEMLGLKVIYLEGGSGTCCPINKNLIKEVKNNISTPLIVGGGINSITMASDIFEAGADIIVIGTAVEKNPDTLTEIAGAKMRQYN